MSKEVSLIFQDCPYCAPREEWGKRQTEFAEKNGIKVVETFFKLPGVKGLILEARSHGIETMPFFTDGKIFSMELSDFVSGVKKSQPETPEETERTEVATIKRVARQKKITKTAKIAEPAEEKVDEVIPKE